jgi:DNA-binding transcriptional MerR regulator
MRTTADDDHAGSDAPAHSTGWVARRLGVSPATLRTWHRRYRIGPTGRTEGGHRRYLPDDLDRLERMRRLVLAGLPTAEAARVSADPDAAPPAATPPPPERSGPAGTPTPGTPSRRLIDAAIALDQPALDLMLGNVLRRRRVVPAWTNVIVPALDVLGGRCSRQDGCVAAEHLFTECVRTALTGVVTRRRQWDGYPPVLLACLDQEQHSLPLQALAAALAELGCPARVLGASLPTSALITATRRITPRSVFIWAHSPATARLEDIAVLPPRRPPMPVFVGGPGWRDMELPDSITRVDSLAAATATAALGPTATDD